MQDLPLILFYHSYHYRGSGIPPLLPAPHKDWGALRTGKTVTIATTRITGTTVAAGPSDTSGTSD
jgi:hypothetical protein